MPSFTKVEFENQNGIDVTVTLEAPVGTFLLPPVTVRANQKRSFPFNGVTDVTTAKITVVMSDHEDPPDVETFQTLAAAPYAIYLVSLTAQAAIGSIHGSAQVSF
ncbi:MAG TPA: hypothetical protein VI756_12195 [Blastocatellia bacterium]